MHEKKLKKNSNRIDVPKKEIYIKITIRKKKIGIKQNQATGAIKCRTIVPDPEVIPTYKFALHSRIQLKNNCGYQVHSTYVQNIYL